MSENLKLCTSYLSTIPYEYDATDMDDSLRVYISGLETPLNTTDLLNYVIYLPENAHRWIPFGIVSEVE